MLYSRISNVANMSFSAIRENKTLAKISEFTVNQHEHLSKAVSHICHKYKFSCAGPSNDPD